MERKILTVILALAIVLSLGACGTPAATNTENAGTTAAEPTAAAEPAAAPEPEEAAPAEEAVPAEEAEPAEETEPAEEAEPEAAETTQEEPKEEGPSVAVTELKAAAPRILLFEDQSTAISVSVYPENATDKSLTWSSSNESVAEIDQEGNLTAKSKGKTTITAAANDGSGKTCRTEVTVEPKIPLTVEGFGFSTYNYDNNNFNYNSDDANRFSMTVRNQCVSETVRNFDFDIQMIDFLGNTLITSGSYGIGNDTAIGAGGAGTIERVHSGIYQTYKVVISIIRVRFYDGTVYEIPSDISPVWVFTRP